MVESALSVNEKITADLKGEAADLTGLDNPNSVQQLLTWYEDETGESINYYGMDQTTKKWKVMQTYGGKLTENVVQAIARDCLAVSLARLERAGFEVVFHVHDEAIIDAPKSATLIKDGETVSYNALIEIFRRDVTVVSPLRKKTVCNIANNL